MQAVGFIFLLVRRLLGRKANKLFGGNLCLVFRMCERYIGQQVVFVYQNFAPFFGSILGMQPKPVSFSFGKRIISGSVIQVLPGYFKGIFVYVSEVSSLPYSELLILGRADGRGGINF